MNTDPQAKSLLVAEDNPALATVIRFHLQNAGYSVTVGKNGALALKAAREKQFDLIISDHQMPVMTGIELCEALRETSQYADTPIFMLTAKSLELNEQYIKDELKVLRLISKPFSPAQIVEAVDQQLAAIS